MEASPIKAVATPAVPDPRPLLWWEKGLLALLLPVLMVLHLGTLANVGHPGRMLFGFDDQVYYAPLRSIVFDGDVDLRNEFTGLTPFPQLLRDIPLTAKGYPSNRYGIGWALVAAVPYGAVHVLLMLAAKLGLGGGWNGYEAPYQWAASLAHVTAGWLGLVLCYLLMRRYFSPWPSLVSLAVLLVGSPLLFYIVVYAGMPHAAGFMAVSAFLYLSVSLADRAGSGPTGWRWLLLGGMGSLLVVIRYSNAIFWLPAVLPAVQCLRRSRERPGLGRWLGRGVALACAGALPLVLLQLAYWHALYGHWFADTYATYTFDWRHPVLFGYLFSHRHGLFFFSPVSLLALAGLVAACLRPGRLDRLLALVLLALAGLLVYINAAWFMWWFGDGFGARSFLEASPALFLGLAWLLAQCKVKGQLGWIAVSLAGVGWTLALMMAQFFNYIAHDGSTPTAEVFRAIGKLLVR